ncbi:MAG: hypothetical protein P9X24_10690 [Candidatus Hatepunaea meridiana]|nr:hypothetical protein [Candidatus Hatepunaea meridiana]
MVNQSVVVDRNHDYKQSVLCRQILAFTFVIFVIFVLGSCDNFIGDIKGEATSNHLPVIEFVNVPVENDTFSYAPVIHWKGRDADGFVEKYYYADIIFSSDIPDPDYYIDFIPADAWIETEATSDTVYLLTETGVITEHVFYIKCIDDKDTYSDVIYRTFCRSNQAPYVPEIKWWSSPDTAYANDVTISDTLYCLENITDTWPGLGFSWKSSDRDDTDLYAIPLEYRYYLEKVPHDTIWEWVASDWTNGQEIQFAGLETGHYIFTVWVRDDGFEKSVRPATATFDVYKPTFEQQLLLLNVTKEDEGANEGRGNVVSGSQIGELYQRLSQIVGDVEYVHLPSSDEIEPFKSFLGRFKLIVLFSENLASVDIDIEDDLISYLNIGGRLWVTGYFARKNNIIGDRLLGLARSSFAGPAATSISKQPDFIGASAGVSEMPDIVIDTTIISETYWDFRKSAWDFALLPGVDIMATGEGAETVYYYTSYTDTLSGDVYNDIAEVKVFADTIYYPPVPVDCIIKMPKNRILDIGRVENISRGVIGEVQSWTNNAWRSGSNILAIAKISYPFGEPWSVEDTILVDYRYQPTSETHLRPCAIRFEKLSFPTEGQGMELRYRLAVFCFPLYFLDNSDNSVDEMFTNMIQWFFWPAAH